MGGRSGKIPGKREKVEISREMYVVGAPHRSRGKSPAPGFSSCWTGPWDSGWAVRGCLNLSPRPRGVGVRPHHLLPRPCQGSEKPGLQLESPGEEGRGQPGCSWGPRAAGGYLATSRGTVRARLGGQEAGAEHLPSLAVCSSTQDPHSKEGDGFPACPSGNGKWGDCDGPVD